MDTDSQGQIVLRSQPGSARGIIYPNRLLEVASTSFASERNNRKNDSSMRHENGRWELPSEFTAETPHCIESGIRLESWLVRLEGAEISLIR